ncbi:hypothetical protein FKP32DRAFT_1657160 [Trametes sanguinea]|nr:hypothetical protein FKP32DRAFT_1657160 [Trametes sanguinea]
MSNATTLRHCKWCGRPETPSQKLRKCAACGYVLYCSKQCQREGWPDHKESCRYMTESSLTAEPGYDVQVRPYGFANSLVFSKALGDWIEAHGWALQMATQAFVLQLGGVRFIKIPSQYLLVFRLVCRTKAGQSAAERNPATNFAALTQGVTKIDDWTSSNTANARMWEGTETEREQITERMSAILNGTFACVMSALLKCDGVSMGNIVHFPLLHVRKRLPLDEASMDILTDIITLCYRSMGQGFPLQYGSRNRDIPLPGRFSRKAGKWVWEPFFEKWDDYNPNSPEYPALHSAIAAFKTGMSPKQLIEAFRAL